MVFDSLNCQSVTHSVTHQIKTIHKCLTLHILHDRRSTPTGTTFILEASAFDCGGFFVWRGIGRSICFDCISNKTLAFIPLLSKVHRASRHRIGYLPWWPFRLTILPIAFLQLLALTKRLPLFRPLFRRCSLH